MLVEKGLVHPRLTEADKREKAKKGVELSWENAEDNLFLGWISMEQVAPTIAQFIKGLNIPILAQGEPNQKYVKSDTSAELAAQSRIAQLKAALSEFKS